MGSGLTPPRLLAAVLAGKAAGTASRLVGQGGGTTLPGLVASRIEPRTLALLAERLTAGSVLITGTNGKTTTSRLIASLLQGLPARVVANRAGANLVTGHTSAVLAGAGLTGRFRADWGVFEVDEATLPSAVAELKPRAVVVGNLFRDQLDRYGELEMLALTIERGLEALPEGATAVLNADDPRTAEIGYRLGERRGRLKILWYGLDDPAVAISELPHAADARTCPRCGSRLDFRQVYVGHDGDYTCPTGDFGRPERDLSATSVQLDGLDGVRFTVGGVQVGAALGGLYNAYNLLGAFATGTALGLKPGYMVERLGEVPAAFGRQERFLHQGRRFTLMLAKNPAGFNEILREAERLGGGRHFLLGLNDRIADGRDVSWIWDVDFELLGGDCAAETLIATGVRAYDLALRLKYAGLKATVEVDLNRALDRLLEAVPAGAEGFILCTYTAMLDVRALLVRRGSLRPYWRT
ncbi:MurT ligase domain-containing protein [Candidatus Dormibacter sp.]|uniref:Mur ligase family protein n=1 Tax=Candidatus Dormibacter sp. TaxID=2973982 RepID=UPI003D9B9ACE